MVVKETMDWSRLKELFIANDLHYPQEDVVDTDVVKCWEAYDGDKLAGGCILGRREGKYILDGIATDVKYRGSGLGKELLNKVKDFLKEENADDLFLLAKVPEFYKHYGFGLDEENEAPNFYECQDCDEYGKSCFPEIMKLTI